MINLCNKCAKIINVSTATDLRISDVMKHPEEKNKNFLNKFKRFGTLG